MPNEKKSEKTAGRKQQKPANKKPQEPTLPPELAKEYNEAPPEVQKAIAEVLEGRSEKMSLMATMFSGPLPPPDVLREYETVIPGAADRILSMAENQSAHRQHMERYIAEREYGDSRRGLNLGFIIIATLIIACCLMVLFGEHWTVKLFGSVLGAGGMVGLARVFVLGRKYKQIDDKKKE